jgi:hypothetical protein
LNRCARVFKLLPPSPERRFLVALGQAAVGQRLLEDDRQPLSVGGLQC